MLDALLLNDKIIALHDALRDGNNILCEELWNAAKAYIVTIAAKATGKHVLILTGASFEESRLFYDFSFFSDRPVIDFPAWETLPSEKAAPSPDTVGERYRVLADLLEQKQPGIIISNLHACLQKIISPTTFRKLCLQISLRDTFDVQSLSEKLIQMGYRKQAMTTDKGEFSVRGGIIDIFPVSSTDPFRIEFFGDEVDSIRTFDPVGQKSIRHVDNNTLKPHVIITPAQELELLDGEQQLTSLIEYLGSNTLIIFDDIVALEDRYVQLTSAGNNPSKTFLTIKEFLTLSDEYQKIFFSHLPIEEISKIRVLEKKKNSFYSYNNPLLHLQFEIFNRSYETLRWLHPFLEIGDLLLPDRNVEDSINGDELFYSLSKISKTPYHLHIVYSSDLEKNSFLKRCHDAQISLPKKTTYDSGYLSSGFAVEESSIAILPLTEFTRHYKIRRQKRRSTYHTTPIQLFDLSPGELVVHLNHGIGKFLGIEKHQNNNGILSEFFLIEYAEGGKLYVPINQAYLLTKYIGATEQAPKMHVIGSSRWKKSKEHTQKAIAGYARELLELYAKRELKKGFRYPPDSPDVVTFEEDFPYDETEDQLQAIACFKEDMTSDKPMERLICGDVGYGKTEVAMRAAFKTVVDGRKQVAVLVPTTVLAMQHYDNFIERMRNFPVNIGVLSRFRTAKQVKETIEGAANGSVDIVIGTHRLISNDVHFKDLGLVIIDEEQRFGVRAKEHLKKIKASVDTLTLSATPIPRTLYLSLVGARDMSVISTPPQDRLPISTVIAEPNDDLIRGALLRELSRDGQAFYIHNRVETIDDVAIYIKKLLPQARVDLVHGQMNSDEIDSVFHRFKNGLIDILVATTIIENGIDIPNANTILIDQAHHFGLASLYQMRGRVGRWNRRAYAYFLVRRLHAVPEITKKRLYALAEASGYGGGMKLAMRDLEIRGAGNILGEEQSGHVSTIGFHFYCKLLKNTIDSLQGKKTIHQYDTKLEYSIDARIPEEYVSEVSLRMEIYHRLGDASSVDEVLEIYEELKDRFGTPPLAVSWLYHLTRIRILAALKGYSSIKIEKLTLRTERIVSGQLVSRSVLLKPSKTPQQLESSVIEKLS